MDALEQDCIIASEMGLAVGQNAVTPDLSCPICQHNPGWLEVIRNEDYIVCYKCGAIYGIEVTPLARLEEAIAVAALAAERDEWRQDEREKLEDCQR